MSEQEWQKLNEAVPDSRLYDYLLRLSIVAYQQEAKPKPPSTDTQPPSTFDPLPKHTLRTLRERLKAMALAPSTGEDFTRRSYLAFYAQLLELKTSASPEEYEELKIRADFLIVRFLTCASRELAKTHQSSKLIVMVNEQGSAFVQFLISTIRQLRSSKTLIAQLEEYDRTKFGPAIAEATAEVDVLSLPHKLPEMEMTRYLEEILPVKAEVQQDVDRQKDRINIRFELDNYVDNLEKDQHPIYCKEDWGEDWEDWKQNELTAVRTLISKLKGTDSISNVTLDPSGPQRVIPPDPKSYFFKTLQYCLKRDLSDTVILSSRSKKLLSLCCQYWRISPCTYASLVLHCARIIFALDATMLDYIQDCFSYFEHLSGEVPPLEWPLCDSYLAQRDINQFIQLAVNKLASCLDQITDPKPPKMQAYVILLEEYLFGWVNKAGLESPHIQQLRSAITRAAENSYDRMLSTIPRDDTLQFSHITGLASGIIALGRKLDKKYPEPLFDLLAISTLVLARQLKLFANDFMPMFKFCLGLHQQSDEEPALQDIFDLYKTIRELKIYDSQLSISDVLNFDAEALFYPFILDWAKSSSELVGTYVDRALELDTFEPLNREQGVMYSSSVQDVFKSFSASLQVFESTSWNNQYHAAKILTLLVQGFGKALDAWIHKLRLWFIQDVTVERPTHNNSFSSSMSSKQSKWLDYAKEYAREKLPGQQQVAPDPFNFETRTMVYLNDIQWAYNLLIKMEETLNSDGIARRIEAEEKRKKGQDSPSFLYTLRVMAAQDLETTSRNNADAYVTIIDEKARKKLGRTRTVFDTCNPHWNEAFTLETKSRAHLLKLMVWDENTNTNHDLLGTAIVKLDPRDFGNRDYGTVSKAVALERRPQGESGRIYVQVTMDQEKEDIRFYFGKTLRFLHQTKAEMIELIVEKFSLFIRACISMSTIDLALRRSSITGAFSNWLGTNQKAPAPTNVEIADVLQPLYGYLNKNFRTLALNLTEDLKLEVMTQTWQVILSNIESLILGRAEKSKHTQKQLSQQEMDVVYIWLRELRDFFHNEGQGPSLEVLHNQTYQRIMSIPVYYDMETAQLRQECEKTTKSALRQVSHTRDLVQRQRTVMAHRNRQVMESQAEELRRAQLGNVDADKDDIIVRILRMRKDDEFIDRHLEYRRRIEAKVHTERLLQGI